MAGCVEWAWQVTRSKGWRGRLHREGGGKAIISLPNGFGRRGVGKNETTTWKKWKTTRMAGLKRFVGGGREGVVCGNLGFLSEEDRD